MKHSKWFYVRIGFVLIGFFSGLILTLLESSEFCYLDIYDCMIVFFFGPIGLLFVIGIQAINPYSGKVWTKPSWELNPMNLKDPLQFFHLGAFHIMAGAIGSSISLIFKETRLWLPTIWYLSAGIGIWVGVQLCQFAFRRKYHTG